MVREKTKKGSKAVWEYVSGSEEETRTLGERMVHCLKPGDVVALSGELGSGKTTFIQGMAVGCGIEPRMVKSPTFVIHREYPGRLPMAHVDAYRLTGAAEVAWLDLDLIFSPDKVTVIEWAERFEELIPQQALRLELAHVSAKRRRIRLTSDNTRTKEVVHGLTDD